MKTNLLFIFFVFLALPCYGDHVIVVHETKTNQGHDQVYIEPPYLTYNDDLNELYVYFGSTGTIDLEYIDTLGTPCYFVYGESHVGSIYGYTYTGNFSVS